MEHILNITDTIQFAEDDLLTHAINISDTLNDVSVLSFEQTVKASYGVKPTVYRDHTISKEVWYDEGISKCRDSIQLKEYFYLDGVDQGWPLPALSSPSFDKNPIATFQEIAGSEFFTRFPNAKILSAFFKWLKDLAEWHGYPVQPTFNKIKGDSTQVSYIPTSDENNLSKYPWNFKNYFNDINKYIRENIPDYALLFNYWYSGVDDVDLKYNYENKHSVGYMREQYLDFGSKSKYERDSYWRLFPVKLIKTGGPTTCKMYYNEIRKDITYQYYTDRCDFLLVNLDNHSNNYLKIRAQDGVGDLWTYIHKDDVNATSIKDTINKLFSDMGCPTTASTVTEEFNGLSVDSESIRVYRVIFDGTISIGDSGPIFVQVDIVRTSGTYTDDTTNIGFIIPQSKKAIATDGGNPGVNTDMRAVWGYTLSDRYDLLNYIRLVDLVNGGEYVTPYSSITSMSDLETFININLPITVSLSLVSYGDTTLNPSVKFENYSITSSTQISEIFPGDGVFHTYFKLNKRTADLTSATGTRGDALQIQIPVDYATLLADPPTSYEKYCPNPSPGFIPTILTKSVKWDFREFRPAITAGQSSLAQQFLRAGLTIIKSKYNYIIPLNDLSLRTRFGMKSTDKVATVRIFLPANIVNGEDIYPEAVLKPPFGGYFAPKTYNIDLPTTLTIKYCFVGSIPRIKGDLLTNISESEFDAFLTQINSATKYDIANISIPDTNPDDDTYIESEITIPEEFYETSGKYLVVLFDTDDFPGSISVPDSDYFCNWTNYYTNPEFEDYYGYVPFDGKLGRTFSYNFGNPFDTQYLANPYRYKCVIANMTFALDGDLYGFKGSNYYYP